MNKTLANILSIFVFPRNRRRRAREILMFGLLKYIRDKSRASRQESKLKFKYKLAVVAIAKNEGSYFKEWIEYHRLVGVEKFYIYDNESTDDTREVLKPYIKSGLVEYNYRPGDKQQFVAYVDCIKRHKHETKWLALIDLDEFLVPKNAKTLVECLDAVPAGATQVLAPWVMYGSSGHLKRPQGLVVENFKWCAAKIDSKLPGDPYKSIVNPRFVLSVRCHHQIMFDGQEVSFAGILCNHYHCKSWEEYQKRGARGAGWAGRAAGAKKYTKEFFDSLDHNDVLDPIMDKFIPSLKKKLK